MMWVIFGGSGNNQTKHLLFNKQWKKILGDPLHIIVFLSWIGCSKYILKVRQCFKRKKDEAVLKLLNFYVHKKFFIGLFFLLGAILRQLPNIGAGTWMLQLRTLVSTLKSHCRGELQTKSTYISYEPVAISSRSDQFFQWFQNAGFTVLKDVSLPSQSSWCVNQGYQDVKQNRSLIFSRPARPSCLLPEYDTQAISMTTKSIQ